MTNRSEIIQKDMEDKAYKEDKSVLPMQHEVESKINALEYYNSLSEGDKLSFQEQIKKKKIRENYATYVQYIYGDNYIMTPFHKILCSICQTDNSIIKFFEIHIM